MLDVIHLMRITTAFKENTLKQNYLDCNIIFTKYATIHISISAMADELVNLEAVKVRTGRTAGG